MSANPRPRRLEPGATGWLDSADRLVQTLHRTGFLQSLVVHVAFLLFMGVTVIEPARIAAAVRLSLAFDPVAEAAVAMQADDLDVHALAALAEAREMPLLPPAVEAWREPAEPPRLDPLAATVAGIDHEWQMTALQSGLLDEVSSAARLAGFVSSSSGDGGGGRGAGGFGGELGRRLKKAGARTGDVQISIAWDNFNDVDLHVMVDAVTPKKGMSLINFTRPRGRCGGWLDVDQNVVPLTDAAVENVFWARGGAPYGRYTVYVHEYRNWGGTDPTEVQVAILVDGEQTHHSVRVHAGTAPVEVTSFVRKPGRLGGRVPLPFDAEATSVSEP